MANLFITLDLGGAPSDSSRLGKTKTINAAGSFSGNLCIEANCGGEWRQVARFNNPGSVEINAALAEIRVNADAVKGTVSQITVSADDQGAKFAELPVNGAGVDVSDLGTYNTIIIGGDSLNGLLKIQISDDDASWTDWKSYQNATVESGEVVTKFMRATYTGSNAPEVCIGAINETDATSTPVTAYVFRPEATGDDAPGGNVYTDWAELMAAVDSTAKYGPRQIYFDSSFSTFATPNGNACVIPAGTWDMNEVEWTSDAAPSSLRVTVTWEDEAYCPGLTLISLHGFLYHDGTVHSPLSEGLVFRTNECKLYNTDPLAAPMIKINPAFGFSASFFTTGCFLGNDELGQTASPAPLFDGNGVFMIMVMSGAWCTANVFANATGFCFIPLIGAGICGPLDWTFPALTSGWSTGSRLLGGHYPKSPTFSPDSDPAVSTGYNEVRRFDTAANPIEVTLPGAANVEGEVITLSDATGNCGTNQVSVISGTGDTIEKPYLNRPFQSKTWVSHPNGTWVLISDSFEEFVTATITDVAADAVNNSTNVVDQTANNIALTFPPAVDAKNGSTIVVASISVASGNTVTPTITPASGDSILGSAPVADGGFGTWQSDGLNTWLQIA
jgi:hypothetical protein